MSLAEVMLQIQTLPKIDKLRLMQFLATELVKEEDPNFFLANQEYPVWSPYNCSEAAVDFPLPYPLFPVYRFVCAASLTGLRSLGCLNPSSRVGQ